MTYLRTSKDCMQAKHQYNMPQSPQIQTYDTASQSSGHESEADKEEQACPPYDARFTSEFTAREEALFVYKKGEVKVKVVRFRKATYRSG